MFGFLSQLRSCLAVLVRRARTLFSRQRNGKQEDNARHGECLAGAVEGTGFEVESHALEGTSWLIARKVT